MEYIEGTKLKDYINKN